MRKRRIGLERLAQFLDILLSEELFVQNRNGSLLPSRGEWGAVN
ncbi:MAG: hypothetical protein USCAAHI_00208 [Beijerinckiaceae bacterium]|jgi:hypothetical protein|nr:MAG: hypothetical protein USCAAHI_00208 [Beijerinckiaceae bacterium]